MVLIQQKDIPRLKQLLTVHLRNNESISSFIEKCERDVGWKTVGHGTYQRTYIPRGRFVDGEYDPDARNALLLMSLMSKLGFNKLVHTNNVVNGGVSQWTMRRHLNKLGTIPNFKLRMTSCILDESGLGAIESNIRDIFGNQEILNSLPNEPCLTSVVFTLMASIVMNGSM
mmetsp:Transcript_53738/g.114149  ORF Transcript_53738/g.114149 Transcript_53738/m.114149 type:complete len:171 (+) Transcript_53738:626-1138(+)